MESQKFIEELIQLSEADNYVEAVEEWEPVIDAVHDEKRKFTCLCGKPLEYLFFAKNLKNNKKIIVGCECIKKFMPDIYLNEKWKKCERLIKEVAKDKSMLAYHVGAISLVECAFYKIHIKTYNDANRKTTLGRSKLSKMDAIQNKIDSCVLKEINLAEAIDIRDSIVSKMNEIKAHEAEEAKYKEKLSNDIALSALVKGKINVWEAAFYKLHRHKWNSGHHITPKQDSLMRNIHKKICVSKPVHVSFEHIDKCETDLDNEIQKQIKSKQEWLKKNKPELFQYESRPQAKPIEETNDIEDEEYIDEVNLSKRHILGAW